MTPQERQLIAELFDRLSSLEKTPRDPAAERVIADGLSRAPNAIYPLVQTVLVQDEALKRANDRIQELESGYEDASNGSPGFLDSMRGALFGRDPGARGSVPSVSSRASEPPPPQGASMPPYGGYAGPPPGGAPGGSFLGSAASTAAGVIGGSLLLDGIRSMFGEHGHTFGAYEPAPGHSPWGDNAGGSDLAREAGINDIGDRGRGCRDEYSSQRLVDNADDDDDSDFDGDDSGGFDDGGSDGGDVA